MPIHCSQAKSQKFQPIQEGSMWLGPYLSLWACHAPICSLCLSRLAFQPACYNPSHPKPLYMLAPSPLTPQISTQKSLIQSLTLPHQTKPSALSPALHSLVLKQNHTKLIIGCLTPKLECKLHKSRSVSVLYLTT